nr:unnamed protein product [Callosobruchus chinensis]
MQKQNVSQLDGKRRRNKSPKLFRLARALEGVRIHREFCDAILNMPNLNDLIKLTFNENIRLEEILNTKY